MLFQEVNRCRRALAVGLLRVVAISRQPSGAWPEPRTGRDRKDLVLVVFVATPRIDDLLPRLRVVETAGANLSRHAVVIQLADAGDEVAILAKQLGQRDDVGNVLARK